MADAATTLNLARRLSLAIRAYKIYGPEHPYIRNVRPPGQHHPALFAR